MPLLTVRPLRIQESATYPGTFGYAGLSNGSLVAMVGGGEWAFETVVRAADLTGTKVLASAHGLKGGANHGAEISLVNGALRFRRYYDTTLEQVTFSTPITVDTWYYLAVTGNGSTVTLYVQPYQGEITSEADTVAWESYSDASAYTCRAWRSTDGGSDNYAVVDTYYWRFRKASATLSAKHRWKIVAGWSENWGVQYWSSPRNLFTAEEMTDWTSTLDWSAITALWGSTAYAVFSLMSDWTPVAILTDHVDIDYSATTPHAQITGPPDVAEWLAVEEHPAVGLGDGFYYNCNADWVVTGGLQSGYGAPELFDNELDSAIGNDNTTGDQITFTPPSGGGMLRRAHLHIGLQEWGNSGLWYNVHDANNTRFTSDWWAFEVNGVAYLSGTLEDLGIVSWDGSEWQYDPNGFRVMLHWPSASFGGDPGSITVSAAWTGIGYVPLLWLDVCATAWVCGAAAILCYMEEMGMAEVIYLRQSVPGGLPIPFYPRRRDDPTLAYEDVTLEKLTLKYMATSESAWAEKESDNALTKLTTTAGEFVCNILQLSEEESALWAIEYPQLYDDDFFCIRPGTRHEDGVEVAHARGATEQLVLVRRSDTEAPIADAWCWAENASGDVVASSSQDSAADGTLTLYTDVPHEGEVKVYCYAGGYVSVVAVDMQIGVSYPIPSDITNTWTIDMDPAPEVTVNLGWLRERLLERLGDRRRAIYPFDDELNAWINEGVIDYVMITKTYDKSEEIASVASQAEYDTDSIIQPIAVKVGDSWLEFRRFEDMHRVDRNWISAVESEDTPLRNWTYRKARTVWITPAPAESDETILVCGYGSPVRMAVDSDVPWVLPEGAEHVVLDYAEMRAREARPWIDGFLGLAGKAEQRYAYRAGIVSASAEQEGK